MLPDERNWKKFLFADEDERKRYFAQQLFAQRFTIATWVAKCADFNKLMFDKAEVLVGGKLLFIGEALEPCQLLPGARAVVGETGELQAFDVRPQALARKGGTWPIFQEICARFSEGYFDGAVASQTHHCENLEADLAALVRVVRNGGKVVLVDHGPTADFFELAKHNVILEYLHDLFVTWAGARHVDVDEAYEYQKANWLRYTAQDLLRGMKGLLVDVDLLDWKGLVLIDGRKRIEVTKGSGG